jgi:hypothetical protein
MPSPRIPEWCSDFANVLRLGHYLVDTLEIQTPQELLYYFEKPLKWDTEYAEMLDAATRPMPIYEAPITEMEDPDDATDETPDPEPVAA